MNAGLQCYEETLWSLREGRNWPSRLDMMASTADILSLSAVISDDDEAPAKWSSTAMLLRTVAAAYRGYVQSDPCGDTEWLTATCQGWAALVWAVKDGTPLQRAEALHALYEEVSPQMPEGAALVLDDIASAEMASADQAAMAA
jgi:hypothetical protein